jgi:dihydroorotate dehydrogenase electron transfer subunit
VKNQKCSVIENMEIAKDIFRMDLACDISGISGPGQFVNIKTGSLYLRRPISICAYRDGSITIIYRVVGKGTKIMSEAKTGDVFDVLMPLGNGFDIDSIPDDPILVGGGAGIPPIYCLAKAIEEKRPEIYLGFKDPAEIYLVDEFVERGFDIETKIGGFITDIIPMGRYVCACGPEKMLKALDDKASGGQYSFEARMGCGFGACMGCSCRTLSGYKRICKEGPVLKKEELVW